AWPETVELRYPGYLNSTVSGQAVNEQSESVMPQRVECGTEHILIDMRCSVRAWTVRGATVVRTANICGQSYPAIKVICSRSIKAVHVERAPAKTPMSVFVATEYLKLRGVLCQGG